MFSGPPVESNTNKVDLGTELARLGLSQYEERLKANGFETWEAVSLITEADLTELEFKLGDRRKIQRAIGEKSRRGTIHVDNRAFDLPLPTHGLPTIETRSGAPSSSLSQGPGRTTRRYRRHPRPDPNAPSRPKTAYVIFGEHVRQDPVLRNASFAELAKETGKRWGELPHDERMDVWEQPAADRLQDYKEALGRYQGTEHYQSYQKYLERFKEGRRGPDQVTVSNDKSPSVSDSMSFNWIIESQNQDKVTEPLEESVDAGDPTPDAQSQNATSANESGMAEVRSVVRTLNINLHLVRTSALPLEEMTTAAVIAFLDGTGTLLFFWTRQEALDLVKSVYHSGKDSTPQEAAEVFAMAAVGSHCDGVASSLVQEQFLEFFLCLFPSSSLKMCDPSRMRLFACLAIYRFTSNVESARILMLSALESGRQTFTSPSFRAALGQVKAHYWWNVFRTVVFLESWFAYNTGRESRITEQDLTLYQPPPPESADQLGTIHEKVGELGQLAAYIALDLKRASGTPNAVQAQERFQTLTEWHRNLPPPIRLSSLNLPNPRTINPRTKRSLLQLHILFLGLFVEPYRLCLIDIGQSRLHDTPVDPGSLQSMENVEEQCISAARQSARVASLLQVGSLIRSHCWVTVLTSFTGCSILLFSASQKLLLLANEEISRDLLYTSSHLNVLSFCSYNSDAAKRLYTTLQLIYNDIRDVVVSPTYHAMRELHLVIKDVTVLPSGYYDAVEGADRTSEAILDLAQRTMVILRDNINY